MLYPVCVHQDGNGSLGAIIPDFPGCFSGADHWRELPRMVQEAIEVHCEGEDLEIPAPSSLDELRDNPNYEGGQWVFVDINGVWRRRYAPPLCTDHRRNLTNRHHRCRPRVAPRRRP